MKVLLAIALVGLVALAYCAEIAAAIEQETDQLNMDAANEESNLRERRSFKKFGSFGSRFNTFKGLGFPGSRFGFNNRFGRKFGGARFGNKRFGGTNKFFGRSRFHL